MIQYLNIHKAFDAPVLSGVDLTVEAGEMFGMFGPSGTGKSVLLKTTIGLITPDRGDVLVGGESVFRANDAALEQIRRRVGYVFQNAALFDSETVLDNVRLGISDADASRLGQREVVKRVWEAIELVNLDPAAVLSKIPAELSGGMRKRVGIARAIVGRPAILLWDEPTTGLDPVNTVGIERLISGLSEELKVTSIVVTHDIEGGLLMCDRVSMLEGGRLRFCGTPAEFNASQDPVVRAFVDRTAAMAALDQIDLR